MGTLKFFLLSLSFILFSCKENKKEEISTLIAEWQGKEIVFPTKMIFTRLGTDTIKNHPFPQSDYKVLVYVDSLGCTNCKLQLPKWKELIREINSLSGSSVSFLFFFQSKNGKDRELHYIMKRDDFNYPICIDHGNQLIKLNRFPANTTFQSFLLDKDNKVVLIGNPVYNPAVKELYLRRLTGKSDPASSEVKTLAEVINDEIDYGTFGKSEAQTRVFELKNTGNNPLVIVTVSTTCACAETVYDKRPVKPGEILRVNVVMTPTESGVFQETLTIRCNTNNLLKVKIRGNIL